MGSDCISSFSLLIFLLSKVTSQIWTEFEFFRDFMPLQIICMSRKDPVKTEKALLRTRSNMVLFSTQGQVTPT